MDKMALVPRMEKGIIWLGKLPEGAKPLKNCPVCVTLDSPTMETVRKLPQEVKTHDAFLIVDSKNLDRWCGLLESCCLRYGTDYLDDVAARHLLAAARGDGSVRRLAVMYGNCQMHDYFDSLNMTDAFCRDYEAVYFKYLEYPRWKEDRLELLLEMCSLLVYTKEGFDEKFRNCGRYVQRHNPGCRTIKITTYSFRGYFPQTNPHIQEKGEFDIVAELFNSYHREDKFINRLIREGQSIREITRIVTSGSCFSPEQIRRNLEISLKQLEAMDRGSDVKIHAFVREHYRTHRLFKDPVHMENIMVWYVAGQILALLGYEQADPVPEKTIHYFTQLPIYPEVGRILQLQWSDDALCPQIRLAQGMIQVCFAEYVERYCRFAESAWQIKSSLVIQPDRDNVKEWFPGYAP